LIRRNPRSGFRRESIILAAFNSRRAGQAGIQVRFGSDAEIRAADFVANQSSPRLSTAEGLVKRGSIRSIAHRHPGESRDPAPDIETA